MIARLFEVRCDRCPACAGPAETMRDAKAAARKTGWIRYGGKDHCPKCLVAPAVNR